MNILIMLLYAGVFSLCVSLVGTGGVANALTQAGTDAEGQCVLEQKVQGETARVLKLCCADGRLGYASQGVWVTGSNFTFEPPTDVSYLSCGSSMGAQWYQADNCQTAQATNPKHWYQGKCPLYEDERGQTDVTLCTTGPKGTCTCVLVNDWDRMRNKWSGKTIVYPDGSIRNPCKP